MSSDSNATSIAAAAAIGGSSSANNNKKQKMSPPNESLLWADDDISIQGILPFVGVGQYAFVGAVNKKMNHYCKIEPKKNPRKLEIL
ncbi:expressed unknown protein [Seminavis robusta]|uniref:Uncharacterized protein n=1 Tax=Seminavis robusta TaxID=568900 RepID=A0A9N8DVC6_9STRA|nr:expressed unknown protein [Seminavis robusta]|eukprot:Sro385_g131710.1 n/a (87) ;mRNA; r:49587-50012